MLHCTLSSTIKKEKGYCDYPNVKQQELKNNENMNGKEEKFEREC
jgi:hypothetical protein